MAAKGWMALKEQIMRTYPYQVTPVACGLLVCWLAASLGPHALAQPPREGSSGEMRGGWSRGGDSDGGRDRGGRSEGGWGGDRGGDRGGGERGGFNPADMLKRFDRNGNNMIDPEEAQGPAQFFLQRLAQNNPEIDLSKPVPIDKLVGEMDRMRGGSGSSRGGDVESQESKLPELLVPDFSLKTTPEPLPGFGASSSVFNVKVEDRDTKEAEDRMGRYDTNKDGLLDADELKRGRWSDDPLQYDRNRDGKLSKSELAVRYAQRRVAEQATQQKDQSQRNDSRSWRGGDSRGWSRSENRPEEAKEPVSRFGDAKSYRSTAAASSKVSGLPDFFARSDVNGDGQVTMNEFSSSWNAETLAEFQKWDLNGDGVILPSECIAALAAGARVSGMTAGSAANAPTDASASKASTASSSARSAPGGPELEWAKRQIGKYDSNGDGQLTANEWKAMLVDPTPADTNGDGVITAEEYAAFRAK